jgi:integrase
VAYAEKRGKSHAPWRVKYKLPTGAEASESGFETKAAALAWGRDQEAAIRAGTWQDPNAGKITLSQWIDRWLPLQDVGLSTADHRDYMIRRFIRPALGDEPLDAISSEQVATWEASIPAQTGVSSRTARAARTLLGTILGDAAAARPPLIPFNPAVRPRNRGRRTGRRLEREPQRTWATPLETLLIAERAALLSGRDDDFTLIMTMGYTGLRWGEAIGLELGYVFPAEIHVEWQLHELGGKFHRLPPKDDSYRSPYWEPKLPVDLPDFLGLLISQQAKTEAQCACVAEHGGSGRYLFLGPDGGHPRRSNYARRVFRPACDGKTTDAPDRLARTVIVDPTRWPGLPIATWSAPRSPDVPYEPPRGRGITAIPDDTPLACWLPIRPGLTPHGLRHSHKTWMAEDGIPEILAEQRLGHQVPGMRGLYAHVSERMREDLKHALQARWEESLQGRAALSQRSPVPLLDGLLTREDERREKMISQIPPKLTARQPRESRNEPVLKPSDLARYHREGSGANETRTRDPLLAKQVLFQLSYSPGIVWSKGKGPRRSAGYSSEVVASVQRSSSARSACTLRQIAATPSAMRARMISFFTVAFLTSPASGVQPSGQVRRPDASSSRLLSSPLIRRSRKSVTTA